MTCDTTPLEEAVRRLETALETPIVPGEMSEWCKIAVRSAAEVEEELERSLRETHAPLLTEISEVDPEQIPRVEQLKDTDRELSERAEKLKYRLDKLCSATAVAGKDEVRVSNQVEESVKIGLQFVIDIRKQELALSTWHSEALKRDRGVAD